MLPTFRTNRVLPGSLLNGFLSDGFLSNFPDWDKGYTNSTTPAVNVKEDDKGYVIEVAAPGLEKKDFKISFDKNVLSISSAKENVANAEADGYLRREFNYTSFSRSFTLPENIDGNKIKAQHKNGLLTVSIPKEELSVKQVKEIAIN
jgi:HSP20 family protein